ncbi:MAG: heavy metal-binding domain-containing protein [Actinomycetota bacterium]
MIIVLIQLAIPLALIGAAIGGRIAHRRRGAHIERRRAAVAHIAVSPRPAHPGLGELSNGELVIGSVVVGADYIRQLVGGLRNLIGGEVRSFTPVLDQARAESSLRMLEAANAKGAVAVVNVRFEAVRINNNASELVSYGTLVH